MSEDRYEVVPVWFVRDKKKYTNVQENGQSKVLHSYEAAQSLENHLNSAYEEGTKVTLESSPKV